LSDALARESNMPKKKKDEIPRLVIPKNATLRQIYAICRREFTAADLQKFTEVGPTVPMEQVLAEMERIHEEETRKRGKK
jgi:hypothetical protein